MNTATASHLHLPLTLKYLDTGSLAQERQSSGGTLRQIVMCKLIVARCLSSRTYITYQISIYAISQTRAHSGRLGAFGPRVKPK